MLDSLFDRPPPNLTLDNVTGVLSGNLSQYAVRSLLITPLYVGGTDRFPGLASSLKLAVGPAEQPQNVSYVVVAAGGVTHIVRGIVRHGDAVFVVPEWRRDRLCHGRMQPRGRRPWSLQCPVCSRDLCVVAVFVLLLLFRSRFVDESPRGFVYVGNITVVPAANESQFDYYANYFTRLPNATDYNMFNSSIAKTVG